jgi:hypothetical protein
VNVRVRVDEDHALISMTRFRPCALA